MGNSWTAKVPENFEMKSRKELNKMAGRKKVQKQKEEKEQETNHFASFL